MKFERNTNLEGLRGRDAKPFEWYSVSLNLIGLHVHNNTPSGRWAFKISGTVERISDNTYATKDEAINACKEAATRLLTQASITINS
jgi:hypothetical protein